MTEFIHLPVMAAEVEEHLQPRAGDFYFDGTVGLGGHAALIAARLGAGGRVVGIDRDGAALARAREKLRAAPCPVTLNQASFEELGEVLDGLGAANSGAARPQRMLLDLGVSSMQLDDPDRGFSFRYAAPLDMRMDARQSLTAAQIVNTYAESELTEIFFRYGEERFSRRIARRISETRGKTPINTTDALAELIAGAAPRLGKIHPATRVFQALRIAVNDEIGVLERTLPLAFDRLAEGGRLAVITFHSLEDRVVKHFFRALADKKIATLPFRKAIKVSETEAKTNRRARSAKLRVVEKIIKN